MADDTLSILNAVREGELSPADALARLKAEPFVDLGFAKIDYHRGVRQGAAEVIYGQNKSDDQIVRIIQDMRSRDLSNVMVTRISRETANNLESNGIELTYYNEARIAVCMPREIPRVGSVVVASAGTSDIKVCEEAAVTLETMGSNAVRVYDVGVAGLHRLLARLPILQSARVIIAVAGMEGALASVIGGLVSCPVVAVPTSVGYGSNFGGLSALLSMLNSCASGVSVVNIDNGFGAAMLAHRINLMEGIR